MRLTGATVASILLALDRLCVAVYSDESAAKEGRSFQSQLGFNVRRTVAYDPSPKIVGGEPALEGEFPFFVQADSKASGVDCGGTLVAPDVVLTSARCAIAFSSPQVLVGPTKRDSTDGSAMWRNIIGDFVFHPEFNDVTKENDFMLFKIEDVGLSLPFININMDSSRPRDGEDLTVIGMGATDGNGENPSNVLRKATLPALSDAKCEANWPFNTPFDANSMLCAATAADASSCLGDLGGPVLDSSLFFVGIVSFTGDQCNDPSLPNVFAQVSGAADWIQEQICALSDATTPFCEEQADTRVPTPSPVAPSPTLGGSDGPGKDYEVEVKYDALPWANAWLIKEKSTGSIVIEVPKHTVYDPFKLMTRKVNLQEGKKYVLVVKCRYGVGLHSGYVKVYHRSELLFRLDGDTIGRRKEVTFTA